MSIQNPARRRWAAEIDQLDPSSDWEEIYRRFALWEHPNEVRLGFQLSFYSPLAVPRMAKLLHRTGHFARTPVKRAYDTGIVMYEVIAGGFDSPRAQQMIQLMNTLHGRHRAIRQDDMSFVLCGLIVEPVRVVERAGWRQPTQRERDASVQWYRELAERMHIEWAPSSYDEAARYFDSYCADQVRPSPASAELAASTLGVLRRRMPLPLRPLARPITAAVVGNRALVEALGLGPYSSLLTSALTGLLRLRAMVVRLLPPPAHPDFYPGQPAGVAYPTGYELDQVGPDVSQEPESTD